MSSISAGPAVRPDPLVAESDQQRIAIVKELAQVELPVLRDLAARMGEALDVELPTYTQHSNGPHPYASVHIGERWEAIQGCSNWTGLLDPIDEVLKAEIIRYGEFVQLAYDAFDSKHGSCKHVKESLLKHVGLDNRGYEITTYLYAATNIHFSLHGPQQDTMGSNQSNWMGFVAICTCPEEIARLGRRDIVIAFRGTITKFEWIANLLAMMHPTGLGPAEGCSKVRVEMGFLRMYTSADKKSKFVEKSIRDQVLPAVQGLINKYKDDEGEMSITITGHSLGSALATLCAYDIAENYWNSRLNPPIGFKKWDPEESESGEGGDQHHCLDIFGHHGDHGGKRNEQLSETLEHHFNPVHMFGHGRHHGESENHKFNPLHNIKKGVEALSGGGHPTSKFESGKIPITVYSFGGPRVGNQAFQDRMEKLGVSLLLVTNTSDIVTNLPCPEAPLGHYLGLDKLRDKLHEWQSFMPSYKHVGVQLLLKNEWSPYLKEFDWFSKKKWSLNLINAHSLQTYLHLVDGYTRSGKSEDFKMTFRDIALVNEYHDFLKQECYIPPCWSQDLNKDLVTDENGLWLNPRVEMDAKHSTFQKDGEELFSRYHRMLHRGGVRPVENGQVC